jgi:16S rRNA (adenine(1408)-N(1))-methyltransferase
MLEVIKGKKSKELSVEALFELAETYNKVHVDLGTGDGLFAWRLAKEQPETLVIGMDAARESLKEGSGRSIKKPARGGAPNAIFICMNVLELPAALANLADTISVNYPWGSLLQAVSLPDKKVMQHFITLGKKKCHFDFYINMQVFEDDTRRENLQLPEMDSEELMNHLIKNYTKLGLNIKDNRYIPAGNKVDVQSTWAAKLTRRSKRPTLYIGAEK